MDKAIYQRRRSTFKRLVEVLFLVFITSSIWFLVTYASPCRNLPPDVGLPSPPRTLKKKLDTVNHESERHMSLAFVLIEASCRLHDSEYQPCMQPSCESLCLPYGIEGTGIPAWNDLV